MSSEASAFVQDTCRADVLAGRRLASREQAPKNYALGRWLDAVPPLFFVPSIFRPLPRHGMVRIASRAPAKPLILHGFEPSPFVKVRTQREPCSRVDRGGMTYCNAMNAIIGEIDLTT